MGWNYLSIPKLQQLHRWSLGMDKLFHPALHNGCNYISMLGLKFIHVGKWNSWGLVKKFHVLWVNNGYNNTSDLEPSAFNLHTSKSRVPFVTNIWFGVSCFVIFIHISAKIVMHWQNFASLHHGLCSCISKSYPRSIPSMQYMMFYGN